MTTIPETLDEATSAAWLSAVLGEPVATTEVEELDQRVSTNALVRADLADGRARRVWVKGYFGEYGRIGQAAGVSEAIFYRDLARGTGVRTLRAVFADVDPETDRNVIVTEDESQHGAVFLSSLDDYSVDQAAQSLEQLAILHAGTWMDAVCDSPALVPRLELYTVARGVAEIEANFGGPIGAGVPEPVRDAERLYRAHQQIAADGADDTPWSVIHGDPHIGNIYLDGEGRPSLVDWQLVQRGPWYLDVGYHLTSVLTVEDRRAGERELVRHYLAELAARGVELAESDELWRTYRRGLLHGFYLWGITMKVDPRKTTILLERLGTAVADHDAFAEVAV